MWRRGERIKSRDGEKKDTWLIEGPKEDLKLKGMTEE